MRVLVLGGSGILSSAVCQAALNKGMEVTCITRGNRDFALPNGVKSVHGDVNNVSTFINKIEDRYDSILDFLTLNTEQLKYRLDSFGKLVDQYIFVSSATAYKLIDGEITENTPLGNQFWDYGENKVKCEKYLKKYCNDNGIKFTIVRPYITYGNTRIPFAVTPDGAYWTIANRILCDKPILFWDHGEAVCTLTHTSDFAKGFVALIGNPAAYNEAYHITSDERIEWKNVLNEIGVALNKKPIIFSCSSNIISEYLPQYKGVLFGDKARNRIFNNTKIKSIASEFNVFKPFKQGIKETVAYFQANPHERVINYLWDGRIDNTIIKIAKETGVRVDKTRLHYRTSEKYKNLKDMVKYCIGRYDLLYFFYSLAKYKRMEKKVQRSFDKEEFYHFGIYCSVGNCDFGLDKHLISIGDLVHISDGVKFTNYRSAAEHFDSIIGDGTNKELRDLGSIVIEDGVYISYGVKILPNTVIGKNTLVLENSVVSGNIPANSVIMGNPAKVIDSIDEWYKNILESNEQYPWYGKGYDHDHIVEEREKYFFEG